MNNNDSGELFQIKNDDFNELYKKADAIIATKPEKSQEYILATTLIERLDQAMDDNEEILTFSEAEVYVLAEVIG